MQFNLVSLYGQVFDLYLLKERKALTPFIIKNRVLSGHQIHQHLKSYLSYHKRYQAISYKESTHTLEVEMKNSNIFYFVIV